MFHSDDAARPMKPPPRPTPEWRSSERFAVMLESWQAASSLLTQELQLVPALHPGAVRENPGREAFDASLGTNRGDAFRTLDSTLNIRSVPKGRAKLLFLLLAMRAPVSAIHFGLLCGQALGESVQTG